MPTAHNEATPWPGGWRSTVWGRWPKLGGEHIVALAGLSCELPRPWAQPCLSLPPKSPPPQVPLGPLNRSALSRSRRALGGLGSTLHPFHVPGGSCKPALPSPEGLRSPCCVKKYFMLKFNGEKLTSQRNKARRSASCSDKLNFAPLCGRSCPQPAATSWHILTRLEANAATGPASVSSSWSSFHGVPGLGVRAQLLVPLILGL